MSQFPNPEHIVSVATVCVGVGPGGTTSMVARVVVVNFQGEILLDRFVVPTIAVVDYRAAQTGIAAWQLTSHDAIPFNVLQSTMAKLLRGKLVVGHSIWEHLSVLGIPHPAVATRDVALYQPFRNALRAPNQIIGLQTLCWQLMRRRCCEGLIDPAENARASMDLYRSHAREWETAITPENAAKLVLFDWALVWARGYKRGPASLAPTQLTMSPVDPRRGAVGIVGSGPAALITARTLLQDGFEKVHILTRDTSPGGVWSVGRVYPGLQINNVHGEYNFSGFKMPQTASGRVSGEEVSAYMQAFAREFLSDGVIRYGVNVVKIRRDDSVWYVTVEDISTKTREVLEYARIVLCTGGCDAPEIPKPLSPSAAQQAGFQGQIIHSKDFAASLPIVDSAKSIVIVGGGRSAQDMAAHLANKGCDVSMVFEKADAFLAYPVALPAFLRRSRLLSIMAGHQFLNTKLERFLHTTALGSWLVFLLWSALRTASLLAVGINPFSRAGPPGGGTGIPGRASHIRPLFWSVHLNDDGVPSRRGTNNNSHFYTLVGQGKIRTVVPARVVGFDADGRSVVAVTTDAGAEGRNEDVHLRADVLLLATGYKSSWTSLLDEETAEKIGMEPTPLPVDSDASPFAYPHLSLRVTTRPPSAQPTKSVPDKRIWSLLHGIVPTKNISQRDFAINGAVFTTNVGYTFEVTSHWISSYFLGDAALLQNIPRGVDLETHAKRKLGWMQLRYPDDALSMSESCGSFIAFWNWPQFADDLLREMGLRTIRSGGNWLTWPFKTIDIDDELATLRDERAAKRSQAEAS
uniref:FAD/NAD(P)-binding domain-containing protein n=1 Tax=Mycena chlorophos TaxID=658473 RepID=A0ABQ0LNP2_MYCCL|nr:FAD/NAD(P)-binding domain-containing protein [Mycena chlorophos]